jgi:hypothetical protein
MSDTVRQELKATVIAYYNRDTQIDELLLLTHDNT